MGVRDTWKFSTQAICIVLCLLCIGKADGACVFPGDLRGKWISSYLGTLTFTNETVSSIGLGHRNLTYNCFLNSGSKYVLQSDIFSFGLGRYSFFTCIEFVQLSAEKYLTYFLTRRNAQLYNDPLLARATGRNVTESDACDITVRPQQFSFLLQDGMAQKAAITCPNILLGKFNVTYKDVQGARLCANGAKLDVCTNNKIMTFDYANCGQGQGNINYTCLYYTHIGKDVKVILYTDDSNLPQQNPHAPLSCLLADGNNTVTYATQSSGDCQLTQTAESSPVRGDSAMVLHATQSCQVTPPTTTTSTTTAAPQPGNPKSAASLLHPSMLLMTSGLVGALLYALLC